MQSLLQTKIWAELKQRQGWRPHQLHFLDDLPALSVLGRQLPFGQSLLYAPELTIPNVADEQLKNLARQAHELDPSAVFFRLEILEPLETVNPEEGSIVAALTRAGFIKAFEETQPEHRQWVDIAGDETVILASMKEKGRYNVRLAERKGVITRISTDASDVDVFYKLFEQTAERDRFLIRNKQYFIDLCQALFEAKHGVLIIAEAPKELGGEPLCAIILTYYDGMASYLYGASSNSHRNLMAPYAAHWAAIKEAKKQSCTTYDLLQISPSDAVENHPYANLTRFKQQFGGRRVDLVGGWDYVYKPMLYQAFKSIEKWRRHK